MEPVLEVPSTTDILRPSTIREKTPLEIAMLVQKWVLRTPLFTKACLGSLIGMSPSEMKGPLKYKLDRVCQEIRCHEAHEQRGAYRVPPTLKLSPKQTIGVDGLSYDESVPKPQQVHVKAGIAWIAEFGSVTPRISIDHSINALASRVRNWANIPKSFIECDQINDYTGETFRDTRVHMSPGAFIQAALCEGYRVAQVEQKDRPDLVKTHVNMAVREWGRTEKRPRCRGEF